MFNIKNILLTIIMLIITKITFAADGGFFDGNDGSFGTKLREGEIGFLDIPKMIVNAIDYFMGIAATVSVIFIIIGAYKILFGSISQDKTKGRDTILMAIGGFIIASLAWFIIRLILDNFS